mmetsp:Transcript_20387/g.28641  ORF Transcript_20387/g.28641 Transcript_20387/m.28641 type:complete len:128 (-) Transcript_20387:165-548(-)
MAVQLSSASDVDQALINETERMVVIRWGYDEDPLCQEADRIMEAIENECINMAVFCTVDLKEVPDFIVEHKLYDPYTIMFFYKRKPRSIFTGNSTEKYIDALFPLSEKALSRVVEETYKNLLSKSTR